MSGLDTLATNGHIGRIHCQCLLKYARRLECSHIHQTQYMCLHGPGFNHNWPHPMTGLEAYHFLLKGGIVCTQERIPVASRSTYWRHLDSHGMQKCSAVGNWGIPKQDWNWTRSMLSLEGVKRWKCEIRAYKPLPQPNLWDLVRDDS
jgi:hypothetical protein